MHSMLNMTLFKKIWPNCPLWHLISAAFAVFILFIIIPILPSFRTYVDTLLWVGLH